jgi:hypothetical protein
MTDEKVLNQRIYFLLRFLLALGSPKLIESPN